MKPASHIPALDGLRGVAVLLVLAFHLAHYSEPSGSLLEGVRLVARFGWVGVDLFFVLSGFLITGILYDHRGSSRLLRGFYGRRLVRIFPLYYAVLALYTLASPLFAEPDQVRALLGALPWEAAYLTNVRIALANAWDAAPLHTLHLWSLAVEEQFYLLWPALVLLASRMARDPRAALMRGCVALVLAAVALRFWLIVSGVGVMAPYVLLPSRMDALAVGALLALWVRGPQGAAPALAAGRVLAVPVGLGLLAVGALSVGEQSYFHPLQQSVGYTLWALAAGAVLIRAAALPDGRLARALTWWPLVEAGKISYGLYLLHYPAMYVLRAVGVLELGFPAFAVATVAASFGLALLSWRYLETPMLRLKRFFPYEAPAVRLVQRADVVATPVAGG